MFRFLHCRYIMGTKKIVLLHFFLLWYSIHLLKNIWLKVTLLILRQPKSLNIKSFNYHFIFVWWCFDLIWQNLTKHWFFKLVVILDITSGVWKFFRFSFGHSLIASYYCFTMQFFEFICWIYSWLKILIRTNLKGAGATFDWLFFDNSKLTDFDC